VNNLILIHFQMTRYKQTDFADEETSSIGSIHLNEVRTSPNMHIRFANRVNWVSFNLVPVDKFQSFFLEFISLALGSSQQVGEMSSCHHFSVIFHVYNASLCICQGSWNRDTNITCQTTSIYGWVFRFTLSDDAKLIVKVDVKKH
jgi:hypothetical protein